MEYGKLSEHKSKIVHIKNLEPRLALTLNILPFSKEVCANSAASAETLMTSRVIDVELEFIMSDFHFSFHLDLHL